MAFRKFVRRVVKSRPSVRSEKTYVPLTHRKVLDNGSEYSSVEMVEMNVSDTSIVHDIPDSDQYKLADLLKAGVPLQEINTHGMLTSGLDSSFDLNAEFEKLKTIVEKSNV